VSQTAVHVRPARAGEATSLAPLLYAVNPQLHDRFAGGRGRALNLITQAFESTGHSGSAEVVRVAEIDGRPVGVIGCYPDWEGPARGRADVRLGLRARPLLRRPLLLAFVYRMQRALPESPKEALYVDALATAPEFRRRGIARALLAAAEEEARNLGLIRICLETEVSNDAARRLYESCGFVVMAEGRRIRGIPRFVSYVRELAHRTPQLRTP
jgi:ribosomal protein S18 acetylase RimI-like enzyme